MGLMTLLAPNNMIQLSLSLQSIFPHNVPELAKHPVHSGTIRISGICLKSLSKVESDCSL